MPWGTITAETILNAVITYFWPHAEVGTKVELIHTDKADAKPVRQRP